MRIGFTCVYAIRPGPQFISFLAKVAELGGHKTCFLTCDGAFPCCGNHRFRRYPKRLECFVCICGGLRSFPLSGFSSMSHHVKGNLPVTRARELAYSSAVTLSREETAEGFHGEFVRKYQDELAPAIMIAYANTVKWIERNKLEAVILFNGRMDVTAAVVNACEDCKIPFITVERTLGAHGIWMVPNGNCGSFVKLNEMVLRFKNAPLLSGQARAAAHFACERIKRKTILEWRLYNVDGIDEQWPATSRGKRILILPSSRNELEGNPEWKSEYTDLTNVLPRLMEELGVRPEECIVRGHPIWKMKYGVVAVSKADNYWKEWCAARGIYYISSESRISTPSLINQCDVVVLNGSSAAYEAGVMGKPMICFGHAIYEKAGMAIQVESDKDWVKLHGLEFIDRGSVIRSTLRFIYCYLWRYPQFVNYVRAKSVVDYSFHEGVDCQKLTDMFGGIVEPDDSYIGLDTDAEDSIIEALLNKKWDGLYPPEKTYTRELDVGRRRWLKWVDVVRNIAPKGDLI